MSEQVDRRGAMVVIGGIVVFAVCLSIGLPITEFIRRRIVDNGTDLSRKLGQTVSLDGNSDTFNSAIIENGSNLGGIVFEAMSDGVEIRASHRYEIFVPDNGLTFQVKDNVSNIPILWSLSVNEDIIVNKIDGDFLNVKIKDKTSKLIPGDAFPTKDRYVWTGKYISVRPSSTGSTTLKRDINSPEIIVVAHVTSNNLPGVSERLYGVKISMKEDKTVNLIATGGTTYNTQ